MLLGSVSETIDQAQAKEMKGNQQLIDTSEKLFNSSRNFNRAGNHKYHSFDALKNQLRKIQDEKG